MDQQINETGRRILNCEMIPLYSARCTSYSRSVMYSNAIFIKRRTCVQGQTLIITSLLSKWYLLWLCGDYLVMLANQRAVLKSNLRKPTWLTLMSHRPFIIARTSPPTVQLLLLFCCCCYLYCCWSAPPPIFSLSLWLALPASQFLSPSFSPAVSL